MVRVALVSVVGLTGTPPTLAPAGTSAPMSMPLGPVPMQGEPAISARLLRMFAAVIGPAKFTNIGSTERLPAPGQLLLWMSDLETTRNESAGLYNGNGVV